MPVPPWLGWETFPPSKEMAEVYTPAQYTVSAPASSTDAKPFSVLPPPPHLPHIKIRAVKVAASPQGSRATNPPLTSRLL